MRLLQMRLRKLNFSIQFIKAELGKPGFFLKSSSTGSYHGYYNHFHNYKSTDYKHNYHNNCEKSFLLKQRIERIQWNKLKGKQKSNKLISSLYFFRFRFKLRCCFPSMISIQITKLKSIKLNYIFFAIVGEHLNQWHRRTRKSN